MHGVALDSMANDYYNALVAEGDALIDLAGQQADVVKLREQLVFNAYEEGLIDGKNADTRKRQEFGLFANAPVLLEAAAACRLVERECVVYTAKRKRQEAIVKLTAAWLYSQSNSDWT